MKVKVKVVLLCNIGIEVDRLSELGNNIYDIKIFKDHQGDKALIMYYEKENNE